MSTNSSTSSEWLAIDVPKITDSKINTHVPAGTIWDISQ